jgi:hypothetical protein
MDNEFYQLIGSVLGACWELVYSKGGSHMVQCKLRRYIHIFIVIHSHVAPMWLPYWLHSFVLLIAYVCGWIYHDIRSYILMSICSSIYIHYRQRILPANWELVWSILTACWERVGSLFEAYWQRVGSLFEAYWQRVGSVLGACWELVYSKGGSHMMQCKLRRYIHIFIHSDSLPYWLHIGCHISSHVAPKVAPMWCNMQYAIYVTTHHDIKNM